MVTETRELFPQRFVFIPGSQQQDNTDDDPMLNGSWASPEWDPDSNPTRSPEVPNP
jgi:hypothetical protein